MPGLVPFERAFRLAFGLALRTLLVVVLALPTGAVAGGTEPQALLPPPWLLVTQGVADSVRSTAAQRRLFAEAYCALSTAPCRVLGSASPVVAAGGSYFFFPSFVPGRFSGAQAHEVLLWRCVDGTEGCPGGLTLLRQAGANWRAVQDTALPGIDLSARCLGFRRDDGRDTLICRDDHVQGGSCVYNQVHLRHFTVEARTVRLRTLLTHDNGARLCRLPPQERARAYRLGAWRKRDTNGDGRPDLQLEVREYVVQAKPATGALNAADLVLDQHLQPVSRTVRRLGWLFDGENFTPTPSTQAFLEGR